jgi:hypothetical protein
MFGNHRPLKVAWPRFVLAGILLAAPAVFAQYVALKPDMKSSLEQRINQSQAQFPIQTR